MKKLILRDELRKASIITFYLYIISIFTFVNSSKFNFISEISMIMFAITSIIYIFSKRTIHIHSIHLYWFVWLFWVLFSCMWSLDLEIAFSKFITLLQLCIFSFIMYEVFIDENSINHIINCIFIAGIFMCTFIIIDNGLPNLISNMLNSNRIGGELANSNTLGMNAAITFIVGFYSAIYKKNKIYYYILPLPFFIALSTGSRKAIMMLIIGTLLLVLLNNGLRKIYKFIVIAFIILAAISIIIQLPIFTTIRERFMEMINMVTGNGKVDKSTYVRMEMIKFGIDKFKENPIIGYGINNFRVLGFNTYSHNNYIELMVGVGLIGTILFYCQHIYIYIKLICQKKNEDLTANLIISIISICMIMDFGRVSYDNKLMCVYITIGFLYVTMLKNLKIKYV